MKIERLVDILLNIRNIYSIVYQMTETVNIDYSDDEYTRFIDKRSKLLLKALYNQNILELKFNKWREKCRLDKKLNELYNEIKTLIQAILAVDNLMKQKLEEQIKDIKSKICEFSKTSKMTLAYARNSTTKL